MVPSLLSKFRVPVPSQTALVIQEQTRARDVKMAQFQGESSAFLSPHLITPSFLELSPLLGGRDRRNLPKTSILMIIGRLSWIRGGHLGSELRYIFVLIPPSNKRSVWNSFGQRPAASLSGVTLG